MKNKIFDFKLFKESFIQNKLVGTIFLVISLAISILTPIARMIEKNINSLPQQISTNEIAVAVIILMYIAPFILVYNKFSFLNNRNASDIYHSVPITRTCLNFTMFISIIAWEILIIIPSVISSSVLFVLAGDVINIVFIPYLIFSFIAGYLLLTATTFVAVNLTGTLFTSIIATGLVTVLPRFLLFSFQYICDICLKVATISDSTVIFNNALNIPIGSLIYMEFIGKREMFTSIPAIVYTFIMASIFIGIGLFVSNKRKSENASKSAVNPVVQGIIRCCITLPWVILIVGFAVNDGFYNNLPSFFILIILAVLTYIIYELITTRKFKNVIKSLPYMLILVAIGGVFYFGIVTVKTMVLNDIPKSENIKSISFTALKTEDDHVKDYNTLESENVKFVDSTLNTIIVDNLKTTVEYVNKQTFEENSAFEQAVTINLKSGRKINRKIFLSKETYQEIDDIKKNNIDFGKSIKVLPTIKEIKSISIVDISAGEKELRSMQEDIWKCFSEEFSKLSVQEILSNNIIVRNANREVYENTELPEQKKGDALYRAPIIITIRGNKGSYNFSTSYRITKATPKALKLYLDLVNDVYKKDVSETLIQLKDCKKGNLSYNVNAYSKEDSDMYNEFSYSYRFGEVFDEEDEYIYNMFKNILERPVDLNKTTSYVNFVLSKRYKDKTNFNMHEDKNYRILVNLNDEEYAYFNKLFDNTVKKKQNSKAS